MIRDANSHNTTVNISDCTFNASASNKAAVEFDAVNNGVINGNIEGYAMNGSFTSLYNNKNNNPHITVNVK